MGENNLTLWDCGDLSYIETKTDEIKQRRRKGREDKQLTEDRALELQKHTALEITCNDGKAEKNTSQWNKVGKMQ